MFESLVGMSEIREDDRVLLMDCSRIPAVLLGECA